MTTEEKVIEAKKTMSRKGNHLRVNFNRIYPFTTENISGYLPYFKLQNKSLLTVGSSSDQIINAMINGCHDITVVDTCPFTKEYYEMKKAAMLSLTQEEYMDLLTFEREYRTFRRPKEKMINKELLKKIKEALSCEESFEFWRRLSKEYPIEWIRSRLFSTDEYTKDIIEQLNPYLQGDNYRLAQKKVGEITPTFIQGNIFDEPFQRKFDNIWLSNVFDYSKNKIRQREMKEFIENLSEDGIILLYYLYSTSISGESVIYNQLYDPNRNIKSFPEGCKYYDLVGVDRLIHHTKTTDGIITYQKRH